MFFEKTVYLLFLEVKAWFTMCKVKGKELGFIVFL